MTDTQAESLARGFREFGYDTVTAAEVKQIWNDMEKGVGSKVDPVAMMLRDAWEKRVPTK